MHSVDLFYKRYGAGGPPLVILHGLLGAGGNWHTLSSKVFGEAFTVYAVDQRNHGRSPHADAFDYDVMAADVQRLMDAQGIDRAHVLGHSMGGKTAMHLATHAPDRVDRLVVADIAPRPYPARHDDLFRALYTVDPGQHQSRASIDADLAAYVPHAGVRQFLLKNLSYDAATKTYGWQMNLDAIVRGYDAIRVGLAPEVRFDRPSLFIRGGASDYVADADEPLIRHHFPMAQLVTLPGAGHWLHAEAPKAFSQAVMTFLGAPAP
ncbi:MAG: alpha/beta fold hydrolase [Bacteroidota bacterium]